VSDLQVFGLIRGVVLPALVVGAIYLIARFTPGAFRQTLRSAGVAGGVMLAYILLIGPPTWPWVGSPSGVVIACLAGSVWPMIEGGLGRRIWIGRFIGLAIVTVVLLKPFMFTIWSGVSSAQVLLSVLSVGTFFWMILDRASVRMHTAGLLATLIVMAAGAAATFAMEGSASIGQLSGALGAALGAACILSLFAFLRPGRSELNGVFLLVFVALVLAHGFFAETDWYGNLWIVAPVVYLLARGLIKKMPTTAFKDVLVSSAISLVPVAFALIKSYQRLA